MTALDRAILEYRENPTQENLERLLAAQTAHANDFVRRQVEECMAMQRGKR